MEIEQPAERRTASHATRHLDHRRAGDESIVESLVITFAEVVVDVLRHGLPAARPHPAPRGACQQTRTDPFWASPSRQHLRVCFSRQRELTERCAMAAPASTPLLLLNFRHVLGL